MRKLMLIFTIIGFTAIGAFITLRDPNPGANQQMSSEQEYTNNQESITATEKPVNAYVPYSDKGVAAASGIRILFFHASWCPQCRALEEDIQQRGVPDGITIFKVDYDNAQDLRKKYGVTLQTTVVKVDETGKLISKFTPYQKPTLQNALDNL